MNGVYLGPHCPITEITSADNTPGSCCRERLTGLVFNLDWMKISLLIECFESPVKRVVFNTIQYYLILALARPSHAVTILDNSGDAW